MRPVCLAMDIGGTCVKAALIDPTMRNMAGLPTAPVNSRGAAREIIASFCGVINRGLDLAREHDCVVRRICVAMCGPLDYARGVSLMQEDKYRSIYNVNLQHEFLRAWPAGAPADITFVHDAQAFLLGLAALNPALHAGRVMAVTLGTGIGSAFMESGLIIPPGRGVPDRGLGRLPYRAGKVENYIGAPALVDLYRKHAGGAGLPGPSVREIAELARQGDAAARRVFFMLGDILGEALAPLLQDFQPAHLALGGQVARALDLFSGTLLGRTGQRLSAAQIVCADDPESAALLGAAVAADFILERKT